VKVLEKGNKETKSTPGDDTIFVDRDPKHFPFILQYLRIQDSSIIFSELRSKTVKELNELLTEVYFYRIDPLHEIVLFEINNRFDAENSSMTIELSPLGNIATRKNHLVDQHHSVIVGNSCKDLKEPRYVEFRINSSSSNNIMIGIASKIPISSEKAFYPGQGNFAGIGFSYYGHDGKLYQNNTAVGFGSSYTAGDRIGILIDAQKKEVKYYKNRITEGKPLQLLNFEDTYVVITLYSAGDQVQIISDRRFFYKQKEKNFVVD